MTHCNSLFRAAAAFLLSLCASMAFAQEAPDAMVKRVSQEVLQIVRTDPKVQAGDQARIREVIETKLLPNFDFERMTALAMGRNWRQATPEQKQRLTDEFRTLLVRTYSGALSQYRDQTMEYKPLREHTEMNAAEIAAEGLRIAASICIYTNDHITVETL
jgi:phospholipid transport system substrate-binding protein